MLTSIIVQIAIAALIAVWVFTLCVKMLTKAGIIKDK